MPRKLTLFTRDLSVSLPNEAFARVNSVCLAPLRFCMAKRHSNSVWQVDSESQLNQSRHTHVNKRTNTPRMGTAHRAPIALVKIHTKGDGCRKKFVLKHRRPQQIDTPYAEAAC